MSRQAKCGKCRKVKTNCNCGRPTKYRPEICEEMLSFFQSRKPYEVMETDAGVREVPGDIPLFGMFALKIGVHRDTLDEWRREHPEFSDAYEKCKAIQENFLAQNALRGNYKGPFPALFAKNNLGYREKVEVEQSHSISYNELEGDEKPQAASPEEAKRLAEGEP